MCYPVLGQLLSTQIYQVSLILIFFFTVNLSHMATCSVFETFHWPWRKVNTCLKHSYLCRIQWSENQALHFIDKTPCVWWSLYCDRSFYLLVAAISVDEFKLLSALLQTPHFSFLWIEGPFISADSLGCFNYYKQGVHLTGTHLPFSFKYIRSFEVRGCKSVSCLYS